MNDVELPIPVSRVLKASEPEARVQRIWRGVAWRRAERGRRNGHRMALLVASALTLVLAVVVLVRQRGEPVGTAAIPSSIDAGRDGREFDLGQGARMRVEAGARLDVLDQSTRSVSLALRRGLVRFDIQPGGSRQWRIDCGAVSIEVVGTRFSIERVGGRVRIEVERGRVLVRGEGVADHVQAIDGGGRLVVSGEPDAVPLESLSVDVDSGSQPSPPSSSPRSIAPWLVAARDRDWKRAWEALGASGAAKEAARSDDVAELLSLADVARLSGHPNEAVAPLERVIREHAVDPRAALAAFALGRLLLDSLGNPPRAAAALEQAIALRLPAALTEDAQARLVEAYARAGDAARAHTSAETYRSRYPDGRRLAQVNHWSPRE
ncbi:MAG: FecR domain-containing protein [Polyangiaceae bacterium]|nr:FecR domain-containing protein [Polyangiaceae bacterium]